jgi:hypothetical protein
VPVTSGPASWSRAGGIPAWRSCDLPWCAPARRRGLLDDVLHDRADPAGMQAWARQQGRQVPEGTTPADAVLAELVVTAPVRTTRRHRPAGVVRARAGDREPVAFDVTFDVAFVVTFVDRRATVPEHAVTAVSAAPVPLPALRLSPVRFRRLRTGGLRPVPLADAAVAARWVLLAAGDGPAVRRLAADEAVRGLLLGSDDGDEFWSAAGPLSHRTADAGRPRRRCASAVCRRPEPVARTACPRARGEPTSTTSRFARVTAV